MSGQCSHGHAELIRTVHRSSQSGHSASGLRIERVVTSGTFALDGGEWEVDNNIWILGGDDECVIIDAAHEADPIVSAVAGREVRAIVCTHGHNDHITVAPELARTLDTRVLLHPGDQMLWEDTHPGVAHEDLDAAEGFVPARQREARDALTGGEGTVLTVGGTKVYVVSTPGHSPGSCCLYVPEAGVLFSGDTLFAGGPGATGRSFSDFPTIIESIRHRLFSLPSETEVYTGHGDATAIGEEAPHLEEWIDRGY